MIHIRNIAHLLSLAVLSVLLGSCAKDFQDDIDKLNSQFTSAEQRLLSLESQVETMNQQLNQLSLLATAVEKGFYITKITTTATGYELTLSNGHVLVLQNGTDKSLVPTPAVSMTQVDGMFFWTLNGLLLTDSGGRPLRTTDLTPVVKYDYTTQQWLISIDGGSTFQTVNVYASVVLNDETLLQVISSYASEHHETFINQTILYTIVSTCIRQNYDRLFNVNILDEVVATYIRDHYTRIFSYSLLEKIFSQYNYDYVTSHIKVEELTDVILSFIREHREIFENSEVLYEILSTYISTNQTLIFSDDLLLEVVTDFIRNHPDYIDKELLQQIIFEYMDEHQEVIIDNEYVQNLIIRFLEAQYKQIISRDILAEVINIYIARNYTSIFDETYIREIVSNYVQNNFQTIVTEETIINIFNAYITRNATNIFDRTILVEVIERYFKDNLDVIIDRNTIETLIEKYITQNETSVFSETVLRKILISYMQVYFEKVFDVKTITNVFEQFFINHKEIVKDIVIKYKSPITDVDTHESENYVLVTLDNGQQIKLDIYGLNDRLSDRVQSIVPMPMANVPILQEYDFGYSLDLYYLVTPAKMAEKIVNQVNTGINLELKTTDEAGNIGMLSVSEVLNYGGGVINVHANGYYVDPPLAVALHVQEAKTGGTDILSAFTVVANNCAGIPADPTTPSPTIGTATVTIPYPNIQTEINECGDCVATLSLTGIQHPQTKEWMYLYGTGLPGQNVWIDVDDKPKANVVTNLEDNATMVENDIIFTVDNSGSMGDEADAIARDITDWAQMLTNKKLNVKFGVVGYGGYIDGAINLTDASSLKSYLDYSTGVSRTMHFGGSDASTLKSRASNYPKTGSSTSDNECGALAIHFADDYFSFRQGANRIYINFTDEPNQPNKNSNYSVDWFKSQSNWPTWKGAVHTVFSAGSSISETANVREKPWRISEYTGGTTMFINSNASDLQLDKLTVSEAMTHSYTIRFLVPKELFDNHPHTVRITVKSTDNAARGVLNFNTVFKTM